MTAQRKDFTDSPSYTRKEGCPEVGVNEGAMYDMATALVKFRFS